MDLKSFIEGIEEAQNGDYVSALSKVSEKYGIVVPEYVIDQPSNRGVYSSGKVIWLDNRERKWEAMRIQHQVKSKEAVEQQLAKLFWDELVSGGVPYLVLSRRGPRTQPEIPLLTSLSFYPQNIGLEKTRIGFRMIDAVGDLMLQPTTPPKDLCLHLVNLDNFKELPVDWQSAVRDRNVILFCSKTTANLYAHADITVVRSESDGAGFTKHNMTFYCSTNLEMLKSWGALKIHSTRKHGAILSELLRVKGVQNVLASNQTQPGRPW
jgi:hypothetical protein